MIIKFRTKRSFYIYDVSTNSLLQVTPPVFDIIENHLSSRDASLIDEWKHRYPANDLRNAMDSIQSMCKLGYFPGQTKISFGLPFTEEEIFAALDNNLINLILEVTQQCNLRCTYCPYSGLANRLRPHNMTSMTFDIAKRAIDYYLCHSRDTRTRVISFYGGEPLLDFGLIEKCVSYARAVDRNIQFGITTNGVLLNQKIISFLEQYSFIVTFSMDGPKALHDRFRVDSSGQGSFDRCRENFERLYSAFSNPHRINVNISLGPGEYLEEQYKFYEKFGADYDCNLNPFRLSFDETNEKARELKRLLYSTKTYYEMRKLRKYYLQLLVTGANSAFLKSIFAKDLRIIHNRKQTMAPEYMQRANGICIPGWEKLFVDASGNFYMCEKMLDFDDIGNVFSGLNHSRILEILRRYIDFCNEECISCWCMHFCRACFINAREGREMRIEIRRRFCQEYREYMRTEVLTYLKIIEENPNAFDFFSKEQQVNYFQQRLLQMKERRNRAVITRA